MTELNSSNPATSVVVQALSHCRAVTQEHSKTFYLGSQLFGPAERQAVWAVYAACRAGDDIADEREHSTELRRAELQTWWEGIEAAYAGQPAPDPVSTALAWAVARYPIPQSAFAELYQGLLMDLDETEYHTLSDLRVYCRRVAGVVGFMIAPVSGYRGGEETLSYALKLGEAMQLTNVLRDVGEDLRRERVYLPTQLLQEHGLSRADLERFGRGEPLSSEYRSLMGHLAALARAWYAEGRTGIPYLHGRGPLAVLTAAHAYEGILDDLERADYDNFSRRAYVRPTRKFLFLPQAWWELRRLQTLPLRSAD